MPVLNVRVPLIVSLAPPPAKITAPVSPLYPNKRWFVPCPYAHTIGLLVPSVDVTKGEVRPVELTLQPAVIVGGLVAVILDVINVPLDRTVTKVPWPVR
jgi:hypothetical protein